MPPAMTSPRGGSVRASSTSGSLSGTAPRREPLRRLYPLQRHRNASDSVREMAGFTNENTPAAFIVDLADAVPSKRRSGARIIGGGTANIPIVSRTMSVPESKLGHRFASPDRLGGSVPTTFTRPTLIRRSSDVGSVTSYASSCPMHSDMGSSIRSSQHGSILKRPSSRRSRDLVINPKQVQFCPNVSVVHMDEDGEHLSTHFQELNCEKRKRLGTLSRHMSRNYDNVIYISDDVGATSQDKPQPPDQRRSSTSDHQTSSQSQGGRDGRFRDLFKRLNNGSTRGEQGEENMPLKKGQFNITFSNRHGDSTKLRFVLHMGVDYNPNDLVVKANTTGSRIRVLATRTDRNTRMTEEFNEKYMLPMDIDPYEIEARLDKWGNLTVEAPLMTVDKRAEVNKTNNVLCAIYV